MAIDLVTAVIVGLLGAVSAVLLVRGVMGMFIDHDQHDSRYRW